jgi:hypothetical protein
MVLACRAFGFTAGKNHERDGSPPIGQAVPGANPLFKCMADKDHERDGLFAIRSARRS